MTSSLQSYSKAIGRVPPLTFEEEQTLARAYRSTGSSRAADRLVTANLRFVVKIAFEYRSCGAEMADLIQEGNIGLLKAAQRFDPDRGIRLTSYAVWWIRAHILNHILRSYSLVKLGTTQGQRRLFFSLARTRRELEKPGPGKGFRPVVAGSREIARKLRVRPAEVEEMGQRMEGRDLSLDGPATHFEERSHLDSLVGDGPSQDEALWSAREHAVVQRHMEEALAKLDQRERRIVEMRFMADEPSTLREMGEHFGLSSERARQLEIRAKKKLKHHLQGLSAEIEWPDGTSPRRANAPWPGVSGNIGNPRGSCLLARSVSVP
jgi:RNA polymerase sigma-32 factor